MDTEFEDLKPDSNDEISNAASEQNSGGTEQTLIRLIVKIIVNATIKECYEEGNKIS